MNYPCHEQGCRSTGKKDALFYLIFIFKRGDTFMSKYYTKTVIGIDVASEFSVATILSPCIINIVEIIENISKILRTLIESFKIIFFKLHFL